MELTWWGSAGFRVVTGDQVFLIDPYLSRNAAARPVQPLSPTDVTDGAQIFLSHGHFDHAYDVPAIASRTGAAVYCSSVAGETLVRQGVDPAQVHAVSADGQAFDFGGYQAQAFFSQHVRFDRLLMARTLARIHVRIFRYLPLLRDYPAGQVLSWRFAIEGQIVHDFGSGGSSPEELAQFARHPTDVLLVPLQGHTRICDIALNYVRVLRPRLVIPHHQDDFYPPISEAVDIALLVEGVRRDCSDTEVRVLALNETITL
jgi:L-ascorbate metabolism protein UlaG (beta-lactamase superfamily)